MEIQKTLSFLLISSLLLPFSNAQPPNIFTAYDMLERFNFPKGILPQGVQSYLLRTDGSFEVFLGDYCEFKVAGNYLLRYRKKISGKLETGVLKNVDGVSVKVFFLWFGVSEVVRNDDELRFYVGPFSATFSVSSFELCPQCRDHQFVLFS